MSELNERERFSKYDSMTTEELQEILRKHANDELDTEPDTQELFYIMEVLSERREKDPSMQQFRSNEEALADFREHHMPKATEKQEKLKVMRFPSRFMKAVAAVVAIVFIVAMGMTISAEAFHVDIWGKLANWTEEFFHFTDDPQDSTPTEPDKGVNLELKSLQDALDQHMITQDLVPTWLPEGYVNKDLSVMDSPKERTIFAIYENNGERLIITIRQIIGGKADQVEKNDDLLEVYTVDGVEYFIFSNTETLQAAWSVGEFECIIGGKITLEEMKAMINSI